MKLFDPNSKDDLSVDINADVTKGVRIDDPSTADTVSFAMNDSPWGETDEEKAVKADALGKVYFDLMQKATRGKDPTQDDGAARAEAVYFSRAMAGVDDLYGRLWKKNGFKTGAEYRDFMHDFFLRGGEKNLTPRFRSFRSKSYDEQVSEALDAQKTSDFLKHLGGDVSTWLGDYFHRSGNDTGLTRAEEASAPEDVRAASIKLNARNAVVNPTGTDEEYAAATETVRAWRDKQYKERVRAAYQADLLAENAWYELSAILPTLSEDGAICAKALISSRDNAVPETLWAKFNGLDDEEKRLIVRARTCMAPRVESGFWNTIGDMGIATANIASSVLTAPWRIANKQYLMAGYENTFDAGFDVNRLARNRQYLWQATGRFLAGGSEHGYLPQLQFEQICEDHGFVAEALIGAASTVPYMAAAAIPYVGVGLVALEAMSEMDDHVSMAGGDITDPDYLVSSAIFGALYAYSERLQVENLLGGVNELAVREAWLKGMWHGIRDSQTLRTAAVGTFSESVQEGVQNGIMAFNEALALKEDTSRAFAEGFVEDFVGSLGTMFVVEAGGMVAGHAKRSGFANPFTDAGREEGRTARSHDIAEIYNSLMSKKRLTDFEKDSVQVQIKAAENEFARLYTIWNKGGKKELVENGVDSVRAEEWDYYFNSLVEDAKNETVPDAERADNAAKDVNAYIVAKLTEETQKPGASEEARAELERSMTDLAHVREVWAQGAGIYMTDEDGNVVDAGAKALEGMGFTPEFAASISRKFHYERAAAFSPSALEGIRETYERRTHGKVSAAAALAGQFGGSIVNVDGTSYMRFDTKDGNVQLVQIVETDQVVDFDKYDEGIAVDVEKATDGAVTKTDWKKMTPEERRDVWNDDKYQLGVEGFFQKAKKPITLALPADPSKSITSEQAATVVGTININSTSKDAFSILDSSVVFHETYHAFSEFAQASGLWTKEDAEFLAKTYGPAKAAGETHDEENAAEGFRGYLARRAAGAMTAEDEKSPFAKIYAAAAGLDNMSAERGTQEKIAGESENAFFAQLVAEANKPKAEPKPTEASAKPQTGLKQTKEEKKPDGETSQEEKETPAAPAADEVKQKPTEGPKTWTAFTPTGNVKVSGHWAVLDLKDVIHSNNPLYAIHMRAQLRNRKDNKAEEDTRKDIVNNFQGERLLEAPDTANGAPIVFLAPDENGQIRPFVLSGNGRVLVLNELADRHLYDKYRNTMKKWAAENGIIVPEGETPILVRVIDDFGGASRDKVADLSNTNSIQQYTEEEQARADAEVVKALDLAKLYHANADGSPDMTPGVNDEFFSEFIRGVGDTSLYNSDRSLTQTARDRAQRALLAIAVGQGTKGRDVVKKLVEQTDTLSMTRQKNAAAIMAAPVAALEKKTEYAIGPDVSRAMADFMDFAEKKKAGKIGTFDEYERQQDLLDQRSTIANEILKLFGSAKSAAAMAEYVRAYCTAAQMEDPSGGLFGAARTREEIWKDAAKLVDENAAEKRYAVKKMNDAARRKDLLATHNLRTDAIKSIAEMGGFAMPSIAVVKDEYGHKEFGDCTVLFDKSTIDPKKNRQNALYSHDAWTPTFPQIFNKIDEKGISKTNERIVGTIPEDVKNVIRGEGYKLAYMDGIHDAFDQASDAADAYARNILMKAAYLVAKGEKVEPVFRDKTYLKNVHMRLKLVGENGLKKIHERLGEKLIEIYEGPGAESVAKYEALAPEIEALVKDAIWERDFKNDPDVVKNGFTKEECVGNYFTDEHLNWAEISDIAESVFKYDYDLKNGKLDEKVPDEWKTKDAITKRVDENDPAYRAWINSQYENPILGKGVYNGKQRFTSSGNRRSWEALHDPATLENIIKAMKKTQRENGSGIFGRNPFGVAVKKFKSINDLVENENILKPLTRDEEGKIKEELGDRLSAVLTEYQDTQKSSDSNQFIARDRALDMMFDAWEQGRGSFTAMRGLLNGWGYSADDDLVQRIKSVFDDMSVMATNYFEAKPQRAVYFNEMKAWIVPDTITKENRKILEGNGQRIFTYKAEDEADRLRAVNEAADATGTRFSVKKVRRDVTPDMTVRTKRDAMTAINRLRKKPLLNLATGIEAQINVEQRDKIVSNAAVRKSEENGFTKANHNAAAAIIDRLWFHAELAKTRPDENADPNVASIKRFLSLVYFSDKPDLAYMTAKESTEHGHRVYSLELEKIESLEGTLEDRDLPSSSETAAIIAKLMAKVNAEQNDGINPTQTTEDKGRAAVKAYAQTSTKAAEDALENYVAYFKLSHGSIPKARTIARIGLSLGMPVVDSKRILKNAEQIAERMRGTVVERAAKNGDVGAAMSIIKREKDIQESVSNLIAQSAAAGGQLTHKGVGQVNALLKKRVESMIGDMTAANLADMEGDTGLDLAAEILANDPNAFDVEYRKAKGIANPEETAEDQERQDQNAGGAGADLGGEREISDADRYKRAQLLKEANEKVARFIQEAKARAADNKAKAEERRKRIVELQASGENGEGGASDLPTDEHGPYNPTPSETKADFKTPGEFAAFLRVWAQNRFAKTHGLTSLGRSEQDKLFAEFYRITARKYLQDLADKLLAPRDETGKPIAKIAKLGNGSRNFVNRRLQEMEKGISADRIERMSADIFAFINKAAIRVSRVDLVKSFKEEIRERFLKDPEFEEFKQDTERKVTGWVEEAARYICRVCDLSKKSINGDSSQLEEEYRRLHEIIDRRAQVYDESGKEVAAAPQEDAETIKANWKLALLDKYGAMTSLMPGQIVDLQTAAFQYLEDEATKLEESWRETRAQQEQVRRDLAGAIVGPNGQRYEAKGIFNGRLFDALNGLIRLRLKHLTRFAPDNLREKADDAINSILVMLGDGETAFAKAQQEDRDALFAGLGQIFRKQNGKPDAIAVRKYIARMDEKIPVELSRQLSNQGFAESMTYGQMLQLLVSLEQRSFKDAIEKNGREGQAELIRTFTYADADGKRQHVFTPEDDAFVDFLRAFYKTKRDTLSAVTMRMVGHQVDSPDPLYCPIRRWIDDKARGLHADPTSRWDPISKIFSRRVESDRDFDESRTILGLFFENSSESAKLTAWAERGSFIRNVVTSVGFQAQVKRAFGAGELGKILKQLEATFNGGEIRRDTPGELAAVDKALNFSTYAYLGFNPLSAAKQTTSFTVWANALPGGFKDLWRHMTHLDREVVKHLKESDEYKIRYGNDVGSGQDLATRSLNADASLNPVMRAFSGAGMWLLKKGDFAPGVWIAQGVYKDLLDRHLKEGMDEAAADKLAITETFNMLEETQQSGRTYNTNMLTIEHGRIGRLLTQFATSPLQQLQYETQAWREWRDMHRYKMGQEKIDAAWQKLVRAAVINHILLPAALNLVIAIYKTAMGEEPPWEKDGYHWSLLTEIIMGQFSRVFFLGAFADTTLKALFKRETPRAGQLLPVEGMIGMGVSAAITVHDLATMNVDNLQKDLERAIKSSAPTRVPYNLYRRLTGDADADRKAKEKAKRK